MRNPDVSHFRVTVAERAANTGSHSEVQTSLQTLCRAPARFAEQCGIHIGVKMNGDTQRFVDFTTDVAVAPGTLGRGGDAAEGGRQGVELQRTKTTNTDCSDSAL